MKEDVLLKLISANKKESHKINKAIDNAISKNDFGLLDQLRAKEREVNERSFQLYEMIAPFKCKTSLDKKVGLLEIKKFKYYIYSFEHEKIVGTIEYKDTTLGSENVGYKIFSDYRRQGFASSALRILCRELYSRGIRSFTASIDNTNVASIKTIKNVDPEVVSANDVRIVFRVDTQKIFVEEKMEEMK